MLHTAHVSHLQPARCLIDIRVVDPHSVTDVRHAARSEAADDGIRRRPGVRSGEDIVVRIQGAPLRKLRV